MQTNILPVLQFLFRNQGIIDIQCVAVKLQMNSWLLREAVANAGLHPEHVRPFDDWQVKTLLEMGERLGVIHKGTEFEIVPVQGEFTIYENQPATAEFIAYAKNHLAQKIGAELHKQGLISFDVLAWQQVEQKNPHGRDWQVKAKLKALK